MTGWLPVGPIATGLLSVTILCPPAMAETLIPRPDLAQNVQALPRLEGMTATVRRTNSALQALDDWHLGFLIFDDASLEGSSRSIKMMADGPDLLTFQIQMGGYCAGAAHPWSETQIVNFDLKTGQQTELVAYLPQDWLEMGSSDDRLYDLYLAALGPDLTDDCRASLTVAMIERRLRFDLGPDTTTQTLLVLPQGLAHVESSCAKVVGLDPDTLRRAGFDPRLVKAVRGQP